MLEAKPGVFFGRLSGMVRDRLWEKACQNSNGGSCLLIHAAANEQGFACRFWGLGSRLVEDFEGLALLRRPV